MPTRKQIISLLLFLAALITLASGQKYQTLVIEPFLSSTFLGGSDDDDMYEPAIILDKEGRVYISGFTSSHDFPTTSGAYGTEFNRGAKDRFISRLNNDLSLLLASTFIGGKGFGGGFIGGNGDELGHGIALDRDGNVYIAGYTESPDYPVTPGSFDESYNGGRDIYITKLDANLTTVLASTFLGGTGDEGYQWPRIDIAINEKGDVYVAGITHSVDFPVSDSAYDKSFNGGLLSGDAFIVKLDGTLTRLLASTYIGGKDDEWRVALTTDSENHVYICGETASSDFPTTSKAYDQTFNVIKDIFISKFSDDLSELQASTIFGGSKLDEALAMAFSENGTVYITGYTESTDFPTTAEAFNRKWNGGNRDAYIAEFNNDLSELIASTLLGGSQSEMSRGLAIDKRGDVFVTGITLSPDFPTTPSPYKANSLKSPARQSNAFIAKCSADLSKLLLSACFGGSASDDAYCIEIDRDGHIYIAGLTSSRDFPTSKGVYDNSYNGGRNDCFIVKIKPKEMINE